MADTVSIVFQAQDRASGVINGLLGSMQRMGEFAGGQLIAGGLARATAALGGMVGAAKGAIVTFEQTRASMGSMVAKELVDRGAFADFNSALGEARKQAEGLIQFSQNLAIKSPYEQEDVDRMLGMAQAFKFSATQFKTVEEAQRAGAITAQRLTKATLDWGAATGKSGAVLDNIPIIMGQIRATGKLMGGDSLQLKNYGIALEELIGKRIGKTTQEVIALREKGLIPADLALSVLVEEMETFGGAADEQSNTIGGLLASLSDLQKVSLRNLFTGAFEAARPFLINVIGKLQDPAVQASITALGKSIGDGVARALSFASEQGQKLMGVFERVQGAFKSTSGMSAGVQAQSILTALGLDSDMAARAGQMINGVISAVQTGLGRLQQITGVLTSGASAGGKAGAILQILGLDPEVATRISGVIDNIVGRVQTGVAGFMQALQPAMPALTTLANLVQTQVVPALTTLAGIVSGVVMAGLIALVGFVSGAMPGVGTTITGAVDIAVGAFQLLVDTVSGIINTISALLRGDWQGAWTAAQQTVQNVQQGVEGILNGLKTMAIGIVQALVGGVTGAFTLLVETVTGKSMPELMADLQHDWNIIKDEATRIIQNTVNEATRFFSELPGRIGSAISNGIGQVTGALSDLGDRAMSVVNSLADRAWDAGAALVTAFQRGIMAKLDDALNAARNMVGQIRDLLPGSDAKTGPLSDLTASGRALPATIAQGVLSNRGVAVDAARRMAGDMTGAWQGMTLPGAYNVSPAISAPLPIRPTYAAASVPAASGPITVSFEGATFYVQSRDDIDALAETIAARIQRRAGGR